MQGVALNPLRTIEQAAQQTNFRPRLDAQRHFERVRRAHLVGDGTDAADARRDVGNFLEMPPAQEGFEKARRLEDIQLDLAQLAAFGAHVQAALALDARQVIHLDSAQGQAGRLRIRLAHDATFSNLSLAARKASAFPVKPRSN